MNIKDRNQKTMLEKLNKSDDIKQYHFEAYRNLARTILFLNSAGFATVITYIGILMSHNKSGCDVCTGLSNDLHVTIMLFAMGTTFIFAEIFTEYLYYLAKINFNINVKRCIFLAMQCLFMFLSILFLFRGGFQFIIAICRSS